MLIGIYWGYVAMIEGLTDRMKREFGGALKVIATGVSPACSTGTRTHSMRLSPT